MLIQKLNKQKPKLITDNDLAQVVIELRHSIIENEQNIRHLLDEIEELKTKLEEKK